MHIKEHIQISETLKIHFIQIFVFAAQMDNLWNFKVFSCFYESYILSNNGFDYEW